MQISVLSGGPLCELRNRILYCSSVISAEDNTIGGENGDTKSFRRNISHSGLYVKGTFCTGTSTCPAMSCLKLLESEKRDSAIFSNLLPMENSQTKIYFGFTVQLDCMLVVSAVTNKPRYLESKPVTDTFKRILLIAATY